MRRIFIASALISPLLLSAAALATPPPTDVTTTTTGRVLSTGVKPAHVVYSPSIAIPSASLVPSISEFVLHLNVNQDGTPQDVQVVKSASADLNSSVASAVQKFRFRPATLDNKPVATDMTLTVFVQR